MGAILSYRFLSSQSSFHHLVYIPAYRSKSGQALLRGPDLPKSEIPGFGLLNVRRAMGHYFCPALSRLESGSWICFFTGHRAGADVHEDRLEARF